MCSMLVLKTLITNEIVLTNADTLVHHVAEPVRHTADQSLTGAVEINSSCNATLKSQTQ